MIKCLLHFIWAVFIISSEQCLYEAVYLELQVQLSHSSGWSSCLETSSFAVKLSAALVPETNQQKVHSVSILLHLTETKPRNKPEISVWGRLHSWSVAATRPGRGWRRERVGNANTNRWRWFSERGVFGLWSHSRQTVSNEISINMEKLQKDHWKLQNHQRRMTTTTLWFFKYTVFLKDLPLLFDRDYNGFDLS